MVCSVPVVSRPLLVHGRRPGRVTRCVPVAFFLVMLLSATAEARTRGPYLTLLFSRSGVTAASNCVADNHKIARLDRVVAPKLFSLGLHPTGSIQTGPTRKDSLWCGHFKQTRFISWRMAKKFTSQYGWSFISHTKTYPANQAQWSALTPQGVYHETCGSAQQISAHGLRGANGSMAWPNSYVYRQAMDHVQACYAFNRVYGSGITDRATATAYPYRHSFRGISGGRCNDSTLQCYSRSFPHAPLRYTSPRSIARLVASAERSQWVTLQSYIFVRRSRAGLWDCTGPDWRRHWTYDAERYCWKDYLSIVSSLPSRVTVTNPARVGRAWGRIPPLSLAGRERERS